jgi:glutaredoxin 3
MKEEKAMMKLYQIEGCPYCARVRFRMTDLVLTYINVNVPRDKAERKELLEVSGQTGVPTLLDGETLIVDDDDAIIEYLDKNYARTSVG